MLAQGPQRFLVVHHTRLLIHGRDTAARTTRRGLKLDVADAKPPERILSERIATLELEIRPEPIHGQRTFAFREPLVELHERLPRDAKERKPIRERNFRERDVATRRTNSARVHANQQNVFVGQKGLKPILRPSLPRRNAADMQGVVPHMHIHAAIWTAP